MPLKRIVTYTATCSLCGTEETCETSKLPTDWLNLSLASDQLNIGNSSGPLELDLCPQDASDFTRNPVIAYLISYAEKK